MNVANRLVSESGPFGLVAIGYTARADQHHRGEVALLPVLGLHHIVSSHVRTESGDVYVCTKPIRDYARQAMILDVLIVVAVSGLYWWGQLPGQATPAP
jgi:hypothetical protein